MRRRIARYRAAVPRITAIEVRRYRYPLDPPFRAAWDPVPRTAQDAEIVSVHTDEGVVGHASGDRLPDADVYAKWYAHTHPDPSRLGEARLLTAREVRCF